MPPPPPPPHPARNTPPTTTAAMPGSSADAVPPARKGRDRSESVASVSISSHSDASSSGGGSMTKKKKEKEENTKRKMAKDGEGSEDRAAAPSDVPETREARRARRRERKERRRTEKRKKKKRRRLEERGGERDSKATEEAAAASSSLRCLPCPPRGDAEADAAAALATYTGPGSEAEAERMRRMTGACRTILECIGEDPDREGLVSTPARWAKALLFMTQGYGRTGASVTNGAVFHEDSHREMVVVRDIDLHSLCEHHMVPFTGRVHVGYIPDGKIIGLSKIARIAEVYGRRLQVQERLTSQIADALVEAVEPLGVAVVVECRHFCMVMRGVQKTAARTVTSSVRGCFESNPKTRAEFFSLINSPSNGLM